MKPQGYLIEKYDNMGGAYTCRRLRKEAVARDMELEMLGIHDVYSTTDGLCHAGQRLAAQDFCINRYKYGRLKDEINTLCERAYNPISSFNAYINKFTQVQHIRSDAFIIPNHFVADGAFLSCKMIIANHNAFRSTMDLKHSADLPESEAYDEARFNSKAKDGFTFVAENLGVPFVMKGLESSMGAEIYLIHDKHEFSETLQKYAPEKEWMFEEYISTSYGRDMRLFSVRGKVIAAMERHSEGDFRANVALGASVRPLEITDTFTKAAEDIYQQTKLDFVGIDLLYGEDKSYFCEINVMPGIEGMEQATGVNVAGVIMETIRGDFLS